MIGVILQAAVFEQGAVGNVLQNLQNAGFFSYIIPFLLIFALVFGILARMSLFKENTAVTAIIALAVGLMALQLNIVPQFFSKIFPKFGIAISIILVILIVLGLFIDPKKPWLMYVLLGIAAIIVVVVLLQSAGTVGQNITSWLKDHWTSAVTVAVIAAGVIGGIIAIIGSGGRRNQRGPVEYRPYLLGPPQ